MALTNDGSVVFNGIRNKQKPSAEPTNQQRSHFESAVASSPLSTIDRSANSIPDDQGGRPALDSLSRKPPEALIESLKDRFKPGDIDLPGFAGDKPPVNIFPDGLPPALADFLDSRPERVDRVFPEFESDGQPPRLFPEGLPPALADHLENRRVIPAGLLDSLDADNLPGNLPPKVLDLLEKGFKKADESFADGLTNIPEFTTLPGELPPAVADILARGIDRSSGPAGEPSPFEQVLDPLNSTGDSIEVDLSGEVGVTVKGVHVGGELELGATVEQTDDGYVVRIDAELAARLGLGVDGGSNGSGGDASVTAGAGAQVEFKYRFDTKEEAAQGLQDLAVTAGNNPLAGHVAAGAEIGADIAHGAATIHDAVTDHLLGIATGGLIDNNPAGDVIRNGTGALEDGTDIARQEIDAARARLNAASDGYSITGYVEGELTGDIANRFGLPSDVDTSQFDFAGSVAGGTAITVDFSGDGDISVELSKSIEASASGSGSNLGINGNAEASVSHRFDFARNEDGRLVGQGAGEITFSAGLGAGTSVGSGLTVNESHGGGFSYTVQADDLGGDIGRAAKQFLQGDQGGALETLASVPGVLEVNVGLSAGTAVGGDIGAGAATVEGSAGRSYGTTATFTVDAQNGLNGDVRDVAASILDGDIQGGLDIIGGIEGDLTIQNHRSTNASVEVGVDTKGVDVTVSGTKQVTDRDDAQTFENITLREGIAIATNEAAEFAEGEVATA